jgi:alcohol dehydrogenase class IV
VNFEFAAPTRIIFGEGRLADVPKLVSGMGSRPLVVEGRSGRAASLIRELGDIGLATATIHVASEPTIALVETGLARARSEQCDVVVALGGGSVIDAAKAISALLTNEGTSAQHSCCAVHRDSDDRRNGGRGDAKCRVDGGGGAGEGEPPKSADAAGRCGHRS